MSDHVNCEQPSVSTKWEKGSNILIKFSQNMYGNFVEYLLGERVLLSFDCLSVEISPEEKFPASLILSVDCN